MAYKRKTNSKLKDKTVENSNFTDFPGNPISGIFDQVGIGNDPLSQPYNLSYTLNYNPLTLYRIILNYTYMNNGIVRTMIDQPVEDALRGGLDITCEQLDADDIKELNKYLSTEGVIREVKQCLKWADLFGGAGIIINTTQDPTKELQVKKIFPESPLSFIAADRWELLYNFLSADEIEAPYNYYGQSIHKSRVIKVNGDEAPSLVRQRLQGWGMSALEPVLRSMNQYVKNQDLIYQLLDEAKIDVWKIDGFNTQILNPSAAGKMHKRLQIANTLKNYHSAIIMDLKDEYEQKQLTFGGLADMLQQIRIGAAADVRMPMSKIFGLSATGFNAGEDDIENYNAKIESGPRNKARDIFNHILPICVQHLFGFLPDNIEFEFKTLRVLKGVEEEQVKSEKFNRIRQMYQDDLLTPIEYDEMLRKEGLLDMDTEVSRGERIPEKIEPEAAEDPGASEKSDKKA